MDFLTILRYQFQFISDLHDASFLLKADFGSNWPLFYHKKKTEALVCGLGESKKGAFIRINMVSYWQKACYNQVFQ